MRIFTSGDNVFNCEGMGPEDEEMARQCSDYLNYIFYKENDGFLALYTAFKDALIQKNGILKVYWDDAQKIEREEYSRLTDDEFNDLVSMDEIKVSNHSEYEEKITDEAGKEIDSIKLHDVVIHRTKVYGKVRIEPVPPEEFLINREAKSIEDARFICHRVRKTLSELRQMYPDIDPEELKEVARLFANAKAGMIFWGMGISQHIHGTDNSRCLISLALMTGQVGRPGTGLHPLRGQNNVQGASDAGMIPMFLPDYQSVTDDGVRSAFTEVWGSEDFSNEKGLTVTEIMDAVHDGEIHGMYILGENPAMSDPDVEHARDALAKLRHLVVQDIFITETANYADVILPASAFAEKSGTVTNTNRQVQMGRAAVSPPGEAREDWWIEVELAKRLGLNWTYTSPAQVFDEMALNMRSLDNITWDRLTVENAVTYPSLSAEDPGQAIVFGEGFPRNEGRAKFTPASLIAPDDVPDAEYPMILTTGRQLEHWHTGSMTRRSKVLDAVEPEANCSLHPKTLRALGVVAGGHVRLSTKRGSIVVMARADRSVSEDMVFLPFAYVEAAANILTNSAVDPYGKIPEFKFSAVKVEAADGSKIAAE